MTPGRRRVVVPARVRLALLLLLGGCVYYPTVGDIGGVRLLPERTRIVRNGATALFFVDITNTGNSADFLGRVEAPIAKRAQLLSPNGEPLARLTVPGASSVRLHSDGERVALSELTRELKAGEVVIVTLVFEKSGAIGVVSAVE
jgi:copper(I)-binding protein